MDMLDINVGYLLIYQQTQFICTVDLLTVKSGGTRTTEILQCVSCLVECNSWLRWKFYWETRDR